MGLPISDEPIKKTTGMPSSLSFSWFQSSQPRLAITVMELGFLRHVGVNCDWVMGRRLCSDTKEQNSAAPTYLPVHFVDHHQKCYVPAVEFHSTLWIAVCNAAPRKVSHRSICSDQASTRQVGLPGYIWIYPLTDLYHYFLTLNQGRT